MLTRLSQSFEAVASDTRYIGRLIVTGGDDPATKPEISIQDQFDEDSLLARSVGRTLRDVEISNATDASKASFAASSGKQQVTIGPIGPATFNMLSDNQRPVFRKFLHAGHPRAFAVGDDGAAGYASGHDAIKLALKRCGRRGDGISCRVLAIDDAVVQATWPDIGPESR